MKAKDIREAKDPVLRGSATAIRRAAALARKTAIQTNTDLIIVKAGKLTRIPAKELRAAVEIAGKPK
jgi:hypothetical protein